MSTRGNKEPGTCDREPGCITCSVSSMLDSIKQAHVDETQGKFGSLNPNNFTIIFAREISTQPHFAIITNLNARHRIVEMYKSPGQRDILDHGRIIRISQVQMTAIFAIEPYVKSMGCHGTFPPFTRNFKTYLVNRIITRG
jgi:hypothetical protein